MTAGSGVDPKTSINLSKRLRNRRRRDAGHVAMRRYARIFAEHRNNPRHPNLVLAKQCAEWLLVKGAQP